MSILTTHTMNYAHQLPQRSDEKNAPQTGHVDGNLPQSESRAGKTPVTVAQQCTGTCPCIGARIKVLHIRSLCIQVSLHSLPRRSFNGCCRLVAWLPHLAAQQAVQSIPPQPATTPTALQSPHRLEKSPIFQMILLQKSMNGIYTPVKPIQQACTCTATSP